ncbi:MAG: fatty acid--CoA ligase [Desulfuromonadales bacterium]|nr:fatty acid--CoA ligase [Desulfuromonadales bacterium]
MSDFSIKKTPSAYNYQLLIKNILFSPVINAPSQEIVYRDIFRYTYKDMKERVCRLANALKTLGIKPGDTVAVMDWDSHRYLECFFAVPMIGAVLHTINVRFSPEQILYTIDHAEDDIILVNSEFLQIIEQIRGRIDSVKKYVLLNDEKEFPNTTIRFAGEYEALLAEASPDYEFPDFDENLRATTFYTTGTTGMPKGVYFSHRQLVLHTLGIMGMFGTSVGHGRFHIEDVYMPITPMFHVHAWGFPYIATMMGIKQVYPGRYVPEILLDLIESEGVTFSHCVPTILHMLLKHPNAAKADLSGWKVMVGGSAMSSPLCMDAMKRGIDIFTGYGMSETCPVITTAHLTSDMLELPLEEQVAIRCKTGKTVPLVDIKVVDSELQEQPRDGSSIGEIVVRAPWLTQGYLKDKKTSERLWEGGYLHTGDVAVRDKLGYIKITDRTKDVIKVAGEWVSSLELEDIIAHHTAVNEVAVIGVHDEKWGERPLALVMLKKGKKATKKEIVYHVREYAEKGVVNKQVVLLKVHFVDSIDKTSVGKIDKIALRRKYADL